MLVIGNHRFENLAGLTLVNAFFLLSVDWIGFDEDQILGKRQRQ
jgi:hypothetical protein